MTGATPRHTHVDAHLEDERGPPGAKTHQAAQGNPGSSAPVNHPEHPPPAGAG